MRDRKSKETRKLLDGGQVGVRFDSETLGRLERRAAEDGRTVAGFVRLLVSRELDEEPAPRPRGRRGRRATG